MMSHTTQTSHHLACKDGDTNHQYSPAERQQKKSTPPGGEKEAEFTLEGVYDVPAAPQEK